jgi:hypothetical protein
MSKEKRRKEIISNLEGIIQRGGNQSTIDELKVVLENIKNGTRVVKKRPGRKPSKKVR